MGDSIKRIKNTGFTLLEVMIALAIIGIALVVILHTVNYHADIMHENVVLSAYTHHSQLEYRV